MKTRTIIILLALALALSACATKKSENTAKFVDWNNEIIYHVMQRSFYDSDGDGHGDLNGFVEKLDYLQELGITAILFLPLYESDFYHNYFPTDYETIDPEFGTKNDYLAFVDAVHARGMKFIMDMETQYVQSGHMWFEDSYNNPDSPYSDYIFYSDAENQYPEQFLRPSGTDIYEYMAWPNQKISIFHIDKNHQMVKDYMKAFYAYWVDPMGDGSLKGGVDGFRIDHIMDDLDYKGIFTNLYTDFWKPIFDYCRTINPDLFIVGEQSNWASHGEEMIKKTGADASFGFLIRYAIADVLKKRASDKDQLPDNVGSKNPDGSKEDSGTRAAHGPTAANIGKYVIETLNHMPEGKHFVQFIENHDIDRWASDMGGHAGKIRCGAVLNLTLPGIPAIYYGQELGVSGKVGDWGYDVNHIPVREAFPWTPDANSKGTAVFYRDSGPWWDQSYFNTGETSETALSVQKKDPGSLWNLYRTLIDIRKNNKAFMHGDFEMINYGDDNLLAFSRQSSGELTHVIINLSDRPIQINKSDTVRGRIILSEGLLSDSNKTTLGAYGFILISWPEKFNQ